MGKIGFLMNAFGTALAFAILLFAQRTVEVVDGEGRHVAFTTSLRSSLVHGPLRPLGRVAVDAGPAISFFFVVGGLILQGIEMFW